MENTQDQRDFGHSLQPLNDFARDEVEMADIKLEVPEEDKNEDQGEGDTVFDSAQEMKLSKELKSWQKEMKKISSKINKDDEKEKKKKIMVNPEPNDLTSGLIKSQGHWVFHIAMFCMIFVVEKAKLPLECLTKDDKGEFAVYDPLAVDLNHLFGSKDDRQEMGLSTISYIHKIDDVNAQFVRLGFWHLLIGVLLLIVQVRGAHSLHSHYTGILSLFSVFLYQLIIVRSMEIIDFCNDLILNHGCVSTDLGGISKWLTIEIALFITNIIVLVIQLFLLTCFRNASQYSMNIHEEEDILEHIQQKFNAVGILLNINCSLPIKRILDEEQDDQVQKAYELIEKYENKFNTMKNELSSSKKLMNRYSVQDEKFTNQALLDNKWSPKEKLRYLWRQAQNINLNRQEYFINIIPMNKVKMELENSVATSDLLMTVTSKGQFNIMAQVQILMEIALIVIVYQHQNIITTDKEHLERCTKGNDELEYFSHGEHSLVFTLLFVHIIQTIIFRHTHDLNFHREVAIKKEICGINLDYKIHLTARNTFMMFLAMDLVVLILSVKTLMQGVNCQPYFDNWIVCTNIINIMSIVNIPLENHLSHKRNCKLGEEIIHRDFLDEKEHFNGQLRRIARHEKKKKKEMEMAKLNTKLQEKFFSLNDLDISEVSQLSPPPMLGQNSRKELSKKSLEEDNVIQLEDILSTNQKKYAMEEFLTSDEQLQAFESDKNKLEMQEDIYTFTFLQFILSNNPMLHRKLMLKSTLCFIMQLLLVFLVLWNAENEYYLGSWQINISRVICAFILHLSVIEEVITSLNALRFANNNHKEFHGGILYPYIVMMMKLWGGIITEVVNIKVIISQKTIDDVMKDFIAFGVIMEIDNLLASSLKGYNVEKIIEEANIRYPKQQLVKHPLSFIRDMFCPKKSEEKYERGVTMKEFKQKELSFTNKISVSIFILIHQLQHVVYCSFYYYFLPFIVIFLSWNPNGITQLLGSIAKNDEFWKIYDQMIVNPGNSTVAQPNNSTMVDLNNTSIQDLNNSTIVQPNNSTAEVPNNSTVVKPDNSTAVPGNFTAN